MTHLRKPTGDIPFTERYISCSLTHSLTQEVALFRLCWSQWVRFEVHDEERTALFSVIDLISTGQSPYLDSPSVMAQKINHRRQVRRGGGLQSVLLWFNYNILNIISGNKQVLAAGVI